MKKYLNLILIISLLQTSCQDKKMKENTNFIYEILVTAPKEFPCEVHDGVLSNGDKFISAIPKAGFVYGGWGGGSGSGMKGGTVPNHLEITWISYAEKKFWKIDTALPEQKILSLFQKGYNYVNRSDKEVHETYNGLIIGLAPGGVVVLWLDGVRKVEIGRFQAKETFVNKLDFQPVKTDETQEQFYELWYKIAVPESSREEIKKNGIPFTTWDDYRIHYNWRYHTISYKAGADELVTFEGTDYVNGEFAMFDTKTKMLLTKEFLPKPLPWRTDFSYVEHSSSIEFDKTEIMQAFKTIAKKHPNEPIEIVIRVGFEYRGLTFEVKCGEDSIPLEKVKVTMYDV